MQIVLIDDDTMILDFLTMLLEGQGSQPSMRFTDPVEALSWCATSDPDLVIVDNLMPGMNGVTFIERFRALPDRTETPILMLTSDTDRGVRYRALGAGANDFLVKPVDAVELQVRVRNMLSLRRKERRLRDRAAWLAEEVQKATVEIARREQETIYKLSRAAEFRDQDTGEHIRRMAHYSRLIAMGLGMSVEEGELLLHAAPMHDIGKVGIPDHILLKSGSLTPDEILIMRSHTVIGHQILDGSDSFLLQTAATIAMTHHERFDGTGYPRGLAGDAIPVHGRIVAVADVFDALSSRRPYKGAWPMDEARSFLLKHAGTYFDPECVRALLSSWNEVLFVAERFADAVAGKAGYA